METIARFVVHVADLVEAEGRVLHAVMFKLLTAAAILLISAAAGIAGVALLLFAVYRALEPVSSALAGVLSGLFALGMGGLTAWLARTIAR